SSPSSIARIIQLSSPRPVSPLRSTLTLSTPASSNYIDRPRIPQCNTCTAVQRLSEIYPRPRPKQVLLAFLVCAAQGLKLG
ncbi:hypothetical protein B0H10DRAFT_2445725, partial [Mycena sp. CBHHK59/15]